MLKEIQNSEELLYTLKEILYLKRKSLEKYIIKVKYISKEYKNMENLALIHKLRLVLLCRKHGVFLDPHDKARDHLIALMESEVSPEVKREGLNHYENFIISLHDKRTMK